MISRRPLHPLLLIGFLFLSPVPARAVVYGPDAPGWSSSVPGDKPPITSVVTVGQDPLNPIKKHFSEAQEFLQSGRTEEALAQIDSGLKEISALPPSRPGVSTLRGDLEGLRDRCSRSADEEADIADGAPTRPPPLRSVEPVRNPRVDKWMDIYTCRDHERFQIWLTRSASYMDLLTRNLRAEGVPEELANLVFVESGFNMHAKSVARAVGPWQFIRGTARLFGLEMTPYRDERRDPELATRAAARYLRRLYEMFDGSWPLALAAYNAGEGTVQRAIRHQRTNDFWSLQLPRETKDYVPQFLAAMEIASNPERYGFAIPENSPLSFDEVTVAGPVDLKEIARVIGVDVIELERLNPVFVRHRSPGDREGTTFRVPYGTGEDVQLALETTYDPKPLTKSEVRTAVREHRLDLRKPVRRGHSGTHVVRRGETLSQIGEHYGTSPARLARMNGLSDAGAIRAGQRLRVR